MPRRLRTFWVSTEVLCSMFTAGFKSAYEVLSDGALPHDAEIVEAEYSHVTGTVRFVIRSDKFEPIEEAQTPPPHPDPKLRSLGVGLLQERPQ